MLNFSGIVRRLTDVVRDLHQPGVGKALSTRKLEDPVIDGRLNYKQDAEPFGFGFHMDAHILKTASGFESGCSTVDLLLVERLAGLLRELRCELGNLKVGASSDIDGRDGLAFVRSQNLLSRRRVGVLRDLGSNCCG